MASSVLRRVLIISAQLGALIAINKVGYVAAAVLHLPLPGNLVGMLLLVALLRSGLVSQRSVEETSSILTRHLAFFFIAITVGLMGYSKLLLDSSVAVIGTLLVSAAIGMSASGFLTQALAQRREDMSRRAGSLTLREEEK
jgi:holin-like protein